MRAALVVALSLSCAGSASAYVRSSTPNGTLTAWRSNCALVQPDSTGTPDIDTATTFTTIQTSMQAWRDAVASCGYLTLDYVTPAPVEAHYDGINVIKFRTDKWCHPDDSQSSDVCYSSVAAGITTVFYVDRKGSSDDGALLDTDVELNNINFTFQIVMPGVPVAPRTGTSVADLENTLVHELGHVQGLDHTCKDAATPSYEVDDSGSAPPPCNNLSGLPTSEQFKILDATMYNSATPGETKKRSPEQDDVNGICAAYPLAKAPTTCAPANLNSVTGGCSVGQQGARGSIAIFLFLGVMLMIRRRMQQPPRV